MKIIKHGNPPDTTKKFVCKACGCEFEAKKGEYDLAVCHVAEFEAIIAAVCKCPECMENADEESVIERRKNAALSV